jgi:Ca-activated chloride channel family protein
MGQLPPKDAVRIEELVNYFGYDYENPRGPHPFSVTTEVAACPWQEKHRLALIGLQGKRIPVAEQPPRNLVFLVDVSGSMNQPEKLPLVKSSLLLLVDTLRPEDRVALVVYAGAAGLVLPPTPGDRKDEIRAALRRLEAGGSTAGGAGLALAYGVAREGFVQGGVNRVILATDGDFNVGVSSDAELARMIEQKRASGVSLSVLGFGMGNYKDSKMEQLADKGNGNYAYIDTLQEAQKVLVDQAAGTLVTIAKDVKIQVEFNPARVAAYRLIGYENRALAAQDFNDDKKDAGEIGAGHSVTALYEVVPAGVAVEGASVDALKYQEPRATSKQAHGDELMTVKLRYKEPEGDTSRLLSVAVRQADEAALSPRLAFASAVAGFGMLLRDSEYKGTLDYPGVRELASRGAGPDPFGYRAEFARLVTSAEALGGGQKVAER